jgi:hypothetical protein
MDGFLVDPAELDHASESLRIRADEFANHPAARWFLAEDQIGAGDLAEALTTFHGTSRQVLTTLERDLAEAAARARTAAGMYRDSDTAAATRMADLSGERET